MLILLFRLFVLDRWLLHDAHADERTLQTLLQVLIQQSVVWEALHLLGQLRVKYREIKVVICIKGEGTLMLLDELQQLHLELLDVVTSTRVERICQSVT